MKTITKQNLIILLAGITKPTFINMITITPVRMNKTGNPYHNEVFKAKNGNYLIGTDYESRVNNNLVKEGKADNFVVSENRVGQHVSKVLLYNEKTTKHYLQHERFDNSPIETTYLYKGNAIDKTLFERFMPTVNEYENQGLEKTVKILSVTVDNIKKITVNGETLLVL